MELLQPVIRPYAWGSRTGIAELQGRPVPAPGPEAELWMGAHPSAPSGVAQTTLDAVIAADPDRELGPACVARFGPRLPFLLKVLSADQALSIQVHPSRAQAQAGFRAEKRGEQLRRRLAQARAAVRADPVRGPGRPAPPARRRRPPARPGRPPARRPWPPNSTPRPPPRPSAAPWPPSSIGPRPPAPNSSPPSPPPAPPWPPPTAPTPAPAPRPCAWPGITPATSAWWPCC